MTVMNYYDQKEHVKGSLFGLQIQRRVHNDREVC